MALVANVNRDPKKRVRPYTAEDFLPRWTKPAPQSPAQMIATVEAMARRGMGTLVKGGAAGG